MKIRELKIDDYNQVIELWTKSFNNKFDNKFYSIKNFQDIVLGGEKISNIIKNTNFKISEFQPYLPLTQEEIAKDDIDYQYLGYYLKWDPQECYYYASEHTGFEANSERTQGS